MPYRRLPNTDRARMRAMKTALKNQEEEVELIIPYDFRMKLQEVSQKFEGRLNFKNSTQQKGLLLNKKHKEFTNKARMYISHFIQVVNMAIQRGELGENVRSYYGIDIKNTKLPDLSSDNLLLEWGEKIINGENDRMNKGGNRIYNPSLALVSINYEKFKDSYKELKYQQETQLRANEELVKYRDTADKHIVKLWDILEKHFDFSNEDKSRTACSAWGINYVYRKNELEKIEKKRYADSISLSFNF
ncbi:hypothetical protein C7377_1296 [Balneicella halophila]|uniref:Uncharacterized protein n=1 Tax=Balneicella halophila TaxID=1537566 RepID=A0A7L4UQ81_BALHA|nr:hypothetical protein [Balneicella halophila]PVX50966.1 hypothetical protein C7377_1296 [Balneicella halophila]